MKKILSLAFFALLISSLTYAGGRGGHGGCGGGGHGYGKGGLGSVLSYLSLTNDQITQISALRTTLKTAMSDLKTTQTSALKTAVATGSFVESSFLSAVNTNHTAKATLKATYMKDVYNLLDAAQKVQFVTEVNALTY